MNKETKEENVCEPEIDIFEVIKKLIIEEKEREYTRGHKDGIKHKKHNPN